MAQRLQEIIDKASQKYGSGLQFHCEIPDQFSHALVDRYHLEEAMMALIANAYDARLDDNRIEINCQAERREAPAQEPGMAATQKDYVRIDVQDHGKGMHEIIREQAFEPFFTTKDVGKGLGLGLSMVYGFAAQSGGFVEIQSELNKGTKVSLFLPAVQEAA
nr:ATP-binding protein [Sneathiella limimaris]